MGKILVLVRPRLVAVTWNPAAPLVVPPSPPSRPTTDHNRSCLRVCLCRCTLIVPRMSTVDTGHWQSILFLLPRPHDHALFVNVGPALVAAPLYVAGVSSIEIVEADAASVAFQRLARDFARIAVFFFRFCFSRHSLRFKCIQKLLIGMSGSKATQHDCAKNY